MGTAPEVGLLTGVISLARAPARLTLRVWEFGLSTAAEAARLGLELIDPGRPATSEFADYRAGSHPEYGGNGGAPDAPPAVPDELVPDHIDEEPVLVAEAAEEGAEDGVGPELHVDPPWEGYDRMKAADIRDRLRTASPAEAAAVELYEATAKARRSVLDAAARALKG